MLRGHPRSSAT